MDKVKCKEKVNNKKVIDENRVQELNINGKENRRVVNNATDDPNMLFSGYKKLFKINVEIDLLSILLFVSGICTRMYKLKEPNYVV